MAELPSMAIGSLERFPGPLSSSLITDELTKLSLLLRQVCPNDAVISFEFDGILYVHIDVRKGEDVTLVQAILPTLGMGLFHDLAIGKTPQRPFCHRVSARVAR